MKRHIPDRLSFEPPPVDFDPAARGHKSCLVLAVGLWVLGLVLIIPAPNDGTGGWRFLVGGLALFASFGLSVRWYGDGS